MDYKFMKKHPCECCERTSFKCMDCGQDTMKMHEHFMVNKKLWTHITTEEEESNMLCVGCTERRLGRFLYEDDFIRCDLNDHVVDHSNRLFNRLYRRTLRPRRGFKRPSKRRLRLNL